MINCVQLKRIWTLQQWKLHYRRNNFIIIILLIAALGLRALSPMTSGMSGAKSYNFSDLMSKEGPKNVPGKGPAYPQSAYPSDAMSRTPRILKKQQQIIRITVTLGRSKYISTLTVRIDEQMSDVLRPTAVWRWRHGGTSALSIQRRERTAEHRQLRPSLWEDPKRSDPITDRARTDELANRASHI